MKIVSWNVNGLRAVERSGFMDWFGREAPDVVCVQEIKARPEQLSEAMRNPGKYHAFWHPAQKPGYSGVAIYSKKEPLSVRVGMGFEDIDHEGRVLVAEYRDYALINAYFPNSQRDHARLPYKLAFCERMKSFCDDYVNRGKGIILCGDFNIAHQPIDLKNAKANEKNAGYLPEERAWIDGFLKSGYVDAFRHFTPDPGHYTWWSYRPGVREKNIGWRLDYHVVNQAFRDRISDSKIHPHVLGSDHCPVSLTLKA